MSPWRRGLGVVAFAPLVSMMIGGCASTPVRQQPTPAGEVARASSEGDWKRRVGGAALSASELASTNAQWTIDAVRRLRPDFLRGSGRGPQVGRPEIALYLNGSYSGDISLLNTIPLAEVREIVFLHPTEARIYFGPTCACANGALLVATRRVRDN